jgi:hypothetical protein
MKRIFDIAEMVLGMLIAAIIFLVLTPVLLTSLLIRRDR